MTKDEISTVAVFAIITLLTVCLAVTLKQAEKLDETISRQNLEISVLKQENNALRERLDFEK
ncbi:hypothetical protein [Enterococcus olivae]